VVTEHEYPPFADSSYRKLLGDYTADFEATVRDGDPQARIPWSRRWRLRNAAEHLAGVHRWAAQIVSTGKRARTWPQAPPEPDLPALYRHGADLLLRALDNADPDSPCWVFGRAPRVTSFWFRRQAQETMIHLWDVRTAVGGPSPLDPLAAADGVDEALTVMLPWRRSWRSSELPRLAGPLLISAADTGHQWLLTPQDGSPVPVAVPGASARDCLASVSAPAETLLLWIWGRVQPPAGEIDMEGDAGVAASLIAAGMTP
jgi:uncharacterized protein (TIGR03083 family)